MKGNGRLGMLFVSYQHCHGVRRMGPGCSMEWMGRYVAEIYVFRL